MERPSLESLVHLHKNEELEGRGAEDMRDVRELKCGSPKRQRRDMTDNIRFVTLPQHKIQFIPPNINT